MRALVTGAAGFIGVHLCRRLVGEGYQVVGLDDLSESTLDRLGGVPQVRFVEATILDEEGVADAIRGCDVVFHQAGKRSVSRSMLDPGPFIDVNVKGTLNVLMAAARERAAVVGASSSSVYGDQETYPVREGMTCRPRSPYAVSKLMGETLGASVLRSHGVRSVWLRYFNVYGPGQDPAGEYAAVIPRFITACLTGEPPVIHGQGHQSRDFTYIDDVVEANLRASHPSESAWGRPFNVGGGQPPTSVLRVLEIVGTALDVQPAPLFGDPRPGDVRTSHADVAAAREAFGYRPRIRIEDGLSRTVAAFRLDEAHAQAL